MPARLPVAARRRGSAARAGRAGGPAGGRGRSGLGPRRGVGAWLAPHRPEWRTRGGLCLCLKAMSLVKPTVALARRVEVGPLGRLPGGGVKGVREASAPPAAGSNAVSAGCLGFVRAGSARGDVGIVHVLLDPVVLRRAPGDVAAGL